ncbi:transposase [Paenibacillus sp. YN15]|uniref:transposase n=1 Tax=Paenibacillus sp. YN15 TaxID=1742774 RepID=UPI00215BB4A0|nr:transposase [Paenibacillus sp. YN15]
MKAEIQQFMQNEQAGERNSAFHTQLFEPYQRRDGWLEEAVIQMYKCGMGTRDVARFIESMFGSHYSPTTVSNITATVLEDITSGIIVSLLSANSRLSEKAEGRGFERVL